MSDSDFSIQRQLDAICDEFEENWSAGQALDIESRLGRVEEKHRDRLLKMLLEIDVELRRKAGQTILPEAYEKLGKKAAQIVGVLIAEDSDATLPPSPSPEDPKDDLVTPKSLPASTTPKAGRTIGPYKLLQQIGEGGMGSVWMAEQEKPVRRRVALKLIRADMGSKETIARFEAERQALAMMDHQNIAKVLDAGTTDDGNPFFVMELVKGIPLTKFCDEHKLSIRERLELFVPVCKAIQHAHQKGIVHRDLKPSNVLVTLYDGEAVPKVIDFGLAKALEHTTKLTDKTMFTEFGKVVGTLQYMSPEQAEMNALDVDTRTDIYSLGVMLYELLTGSTPLDKETLGRNALFQVLAIIKEKEPPRPSHRLSSSGDAATGISAQRKIAPSKLQQILRGELDWVVMKALEKDRRRRYETANDFAQDIQHYLDGEAVDARPPSTSYRIQKFVYRHKASAAMIALFAGVLVAASVVSMFFAATANQAKTDAIEAEKIATKNEKLAREQTKRATEESVLAREAEKEALKAKADAEAMLQKSNYLLANARWEQNRISDAFEFLDKIPAEHRKIEWHLARHHFEGSDCTLFGHQGPVKAMVFDDSRSQIITAGRDKTIRIWNPLDTYRSKILGEHQGQIMGLAIDSGNRILASVSTDEKIRIWNLQELDSSPLVINQEGFSQHWSESQLICLNKEGSSVFCVSNGSKINIWNTADGSEQGVLNSPQRTIRGLAVDNKQGRLISVGDGDIVIWDLGTNQIQKTIKTGEFITCVAIHPDSKILATGSGSLLGGRKGNTALWNIESGELIGKAIGHESTVSTIAFNPDGRTFATGSWDGTIRIWETSSQRQVKLFKGHMDHVNGLSFNQHGNCLFSVSEDCTLKFWNTANSGRAIAMHSIPPSDSLVATPTLSHFARILEPSTDDKNLPGWPCQIKVHDTRDFSLVGELSLRRERSAREGTSLHPEGKKVALANNSNVEVYDVASGRKLLDLAGPLKSINVVSFSPDGQLIAAGSFDRQIFVWDAITGKRLRIFEGPEGVIDSIALSPNSSFVAAGCSNQTVKIWSLETGALIESLAGHSTKVNFVAFSPDSRLLLSRDGYGEGQLRVSDLTSKRLLTVIDSFSGVPQVVDEGGRVVSCQDSSITVWDLQTGEELASFDGRAANLVAAGPNDGPLRFFGRSDQGEQIDFLEVTTKPIVRRLHGHKERVKWVSFSPDGSMCASISFDRKLILWDVDTCSILREIQIPKYEVKSFDESTYEGSLQSIKFSRDGSFVAGSYPDGHQLVWNLSTGAESNKNLDDDELLSSQVSPDRNLIAVSNYNDVVLVNANEVQKGFDFTTIGMKLESDTWWHAKQAENANRIHDSFAFDFHSRRAIHENENCYERLVDYRRNIDELRAEQNKAMAEIEWRDEYGTSFKDQVSEIYRKLRPPSWTGTWPKMKKEIELLRNGCRLFPDSENYFVLALAEMRAEQYSQAISILKSINSNEDIEGFLNSAYAICYFHIGDMDKANAFRGKLPTLGQAKEEDANKYLFAFVTEVDELFDPLRTYWQRLEQPGILQGAKSEFKDFSKVKQECDENPSMQNYLLLWIVSRLKGDNNSSEIAKARLTDEELQLSKQHLEAKLQYHLGRQNWIRAINFAGLLMKSEPEIGVRFDQLHFAFSSLKEQLDQKVGQLDLVLHPSTKEALTLQRGTARIKISKFEASLLNNDVWSQIRSEIDSGTKTGLLQSRLYLFRELVDQHPRGIYFNTLATFEYRFKNYANAIEAASKSLEMTPKQQKLPSAHPGDLAILAMSHFELGDHEKANDYRARLNEAIKLDVFKDDEECQLFFAEVNVLFDRAGSDDDKDAK